jgi:hypothetical protein
MVKLLFFFSLLFSITTKTKKSFTCVKKKLKFGFFFLSLQSFTTLRSALFYAVFAVVSGCNPVLSKCVVRFFASGLDGAF